MKTNKNNIYTTVTVISDFRFKGGMAVHNLFKGGLLGFTIVLLILGTACGKQKTVTDNQASSTMSVAVNNQVRTSKVKEKLPNLIIKVNGQSFVATLYDNDTSRALMERLPLEASMQELNGREKYYNFTTDLSSENKEKPQIIHAGDIMCWSGNCLVLFYRTYENTYDGYVRIGHIDDNHLAEVLGKNNARVKFSLQL